MRLAEHWQLETFEPNSPVKHALGILDAEFRFTFLLRHAGWNADTSAAAAYPVVDPWALAECAYTIGRRFDALNKKPIEAMAIAKKRQDEQNQIHGKKGGQGPIAAERKSVLSQLAQASKEFAYASDQKAVRLAKAIARNHDKDRDVPLFVINGKILSDRWFTNWWDEFRVEQARIFSNQ